jgi:hypothetical protein
MSLQENIEPKMTIKLTVGELRKELVDYSDNTINEKRNIMDLKCYNCSGDLNDEHYVLCDEKCYYCFSCDTIQYININGKTEEGHNIICEKYYDCNYCDSETPNTDKTNFIEFTDNFIFNKNKNNDSKIKYNNKFYHYDCLCKFLGYDYMKFVCNKCKIYCKDIDNMRNINNKPYEEDINVCVNCFNESNIPKCYNNRCGGKNVLPICCEMKGRYNYAKACKKCYDKDWIKQYCDMCR